MITKIFWYGIPARYLVKHPAISNAITITSMDSEINYPPTKLVDDHRHPMRFQYD